MKFRTEIEIPKSTFSIAHTSNIMMLGSCFSENIGERLLSIKFKVDLNPFGVIFNPASIMEVVNLLLSGKHITEAELFYGNECWNSFMHHSRFSNASKEVTLRDINLRIDASRKLLSNLDVLIFTFGTAWVYVHKEKNRIVANCHKLPAQVFERRLLSVDEIVQSYKLLMGELKKVNPRLNFLFTISPIRHLKDGAHGNQVSKSILQLAVHEILKEEQTAYFPAYEILLDELRDYRFFAADMVHPSEMAIDYIFEKFGQSYFSSETMQLNEEILELTKACNHRPVNPDSVAHQKFQQNIIAKINLLEKEYTFLSFAEEKSILKK